MLMHRRREVTTHSANMHMASSSLDALSLAMSVLLLTVACTRPSTKSIAADDARITASSTSTVPTSPPPIPSPDDRGTCVWALSSPVDGVREICRDDEKRVDCIADPVHLSATFTSGADCRSTGFPCVGTTWGASSRRKMADGGCPPGSELP